MMLVVFINGCLCFVLSLGCSLLFVLLVAAKWLAWKIISEMIYNVSSGMLTLSTLSTHTKKAYISAHPVTITPILHIIWSWSKQNEMYICRIISVCGNVSDGPNYWPIGLKGLNPTIPYDIWFIKQCRCQWSSVTSVSHYIFTANILGTCRNTS